MLNSVSASRRSCVRSCALFACVAVALVALVFLVGCSAQEGTAATIGDVAISEDEVSDYVADIRLSKGLTDDEKWVSYLQEKEMSASDVRDVAINELAARAFIRSKAEELGITADEESVDDQVESMRTSLGISADDDDGFNEALAEYGTDLESLRENFEVKNLQSKLYAEAVEKPEPSDEDLSNYVRENLQGQTVKELVRVYGEDGDTMQALLDKVKKAENASAGIGQIAREADGENIVYEEYGWYFPRSASSAMESEIEQLQAGEASDELLPDTDFYQILFVRDAYTFSEDVSDMPENLRESVSALARESLWDSACSAWLDAQVSEALKVNDMPKGLPYDVQADSSAKSS